MQVNPVELLPLESLVTNAENPKKPMGLAYKHGLRASLDRFGFSGIFVVAANDDGTYEVLDGNTRQDELAKAGVEEVPCVVYRGMSAEDRRAFVLAHDRNRKQFDEQAVASQLEALAQKGADLKELARLTATKNLERLLAESSVGSMKNAASATSRGSPAPEMQSFVLYGPAAEVTTIRELIKAVKGRLSTLEKARKALGQALTFLDWDNERVIAVLLATIGRFAKEEEVPDARQETSPEQPERAAGQPRKKAAKRK